jgi:putative hydrolase of the HAD superfamily
VELPHVNIRAVIFDIYGTLLELGPPPPDAQIRWETLWADSLHAAPRLSLERFSAECQRVIAREHAAARARGIAQPEVYWPAVAGEVLPELAGLSQAERGEFLLRQAQTGHTVRLMPGAAAALRRLRHTALKLGLASNCQPYTLRELDVALGAAGLSRDLFVPGLCFFSFEHGFSKPDPHVFQLLAARLLACGIWPGQTLMVGDRPDNDLEPAAAQGWQTWRLAGEPGAGRESAWDQLDGFLRSRLAPDAP